MILSLKPGVQLAGIQPQTTIGITIAHTVYASHGVPLVVTSVCDVAPGRVHNTKHGLGMAFDCRLPSRHGCTPSCDEKVAVELASALGTEWFVLVHGEDAARHIHAQYNGKI